jgi:hypothetical protein
MVRGKFMGKEYMSGPVESTMKECGFRAIKKDMEYGKDLRKTHI